MALPTVFRRKPSAPLGASLIVFSSLFYASYGIWTKLMGNFFGGYTASAFRSVLVLLMLVPLALAYHKLGPIDWRHNRRYIIGMVISSLFTSGPLYFAILHAGVGVSLTIGYAGIVIGMFFFGWLFAGERFSKDKLLSTCLSFIGLWLVFSPNIAGLGWLPLVAAAVSGLSVAANGVFAKELSYNAAQSTVLLWITSVVANVIMALVLGEHQPAFGWHLPWLYLVVFAMVSVVASWAFVRGVKLIDAGAAGILGLMEIVFGVLFGVIFFGEHIGLVVLMGMIVIMAAAIVPYVKDYNAQRGTLENH
jgi:drug/metabolite transporter (DMT)-like permease